MSEPVAGLKPKAYHPTQGDRGWHAVAATGFDRKIAEPISGEPGSVTILSELVDPEGDAVIYSA